MKRKPVCSSTGPCYCQVRLKLVRVNKHRSVRFSPLLISYATGCARLRRRCQPATRNCRLTRRFAGSRSTPLRSDVGPRSWRWDAHSAEELAVLLLANGLTPELFGDPPKRLVARACRATPETEERRDADREQRTGGRDAPGGAVPSVQDRDDQLMVTVALSRRGVVRGARPACTKSRRDDVRDTRIMMTALAATR